MILIRYFDEKTNEWVKAMTREIKFSASWKSVTFQDNLKGWYCTVPFEYIDYITQA